MDEKTKLYVFAKKEVALIFIFMILIAVTSFVFGVKIGKNYSYQMSGLSPEDKQKIELMSAKEEEINKILQEKKGESSSETLPETAHGQATHGEVTHAEPTHGEPVHGETAHSAAVEKKEPEEKKDGLTDTHARLEEELKKLETEKKLPAKEHKEVETPFGVKLPEVKPLLSTPLKEKAPPKKDQYSGKFTIQLGSHKTTSEAEKFADGFRIRGYDPIINEVELKGQTWYRVSLGVFTSVSEAKEYIIKEKSLFQGQDYVIGRFD